jgi:uncharacterized protein (TIGR02145 family)
MAANPNTSNSKVQSGSGTGVFACDLTGLTKGTTYYVKSYAINQGGTAYGSEVSFKTKSDPVAPTVVTADVISVTTTTAVCGGNVTSDGDADITSRGVCWGIVHNPDIQGSHTTDPVGTGTGSFASNIQGLTGNTTYYVRAYAINSVGSAYGEERNFKSGAVVPALTTTAATSITAISATSGGTINSDGGSTITVSGICWSTNQNPSVSDSHTTDGSSSGTFISSMTGLTYGTTYYVRAYATNVIGTNYGNQVSFVTSPVVPTLTTTSATLITSSSASSGGNVTSEGGATVTARGVCWSTGHNPTTANSITTDGNGTGIFPSSITALLPGTLYYVRAYATNSAGTGYGSEISFTTLPVVPVLTTTAVTSITYNSASSGGSITSNGGGTITARGVCWSTSQNPTIANYTTSDGAGNGSFTSSITGLSPSTNYYVKAYATNSAGTGYGNQQPFTTAATPYITVTSPAGSDHWMDLEVKNITWTTNITEKVVISLYKSGSLLLTIVASPGAANTGSYTWTLPNNLTYGSDYKIRISSVNNSSIYGESPLFKISEVTGSTGSVADNDGNAYNTIKINKQWWMAMNLKTTRYNDNSFITGVLNVTDWLNLTTAAYLYAYGFTVANFTTYGSLYNWYAVNTGKLCPIGWHVPSSSEWDELVTFVGGESVAGGMLKQTGTTLWLSPNSNATNSFGFTAFPGGYLVSSKGFGNINQTGFFWTATQGTSTSAYYLQMEYNTANTYKSTMGKYGGLSVRCVKN